MCVTDSRIYTCGHVTKKLQRCPLTTQDTRFPSCTILANRVQYAESRCEEGCSDGGSQSSFTPTARLEVKVEVNQANKFLQEVTREWSINNGHGLGYVCGHCIKTTPDESRRMNYSNSEKQSIHSGHGPNQQPDKFGVEKANAFCNGCYRVVWNMNCSEAEKQHRILHERQECYCGERLTEWEKENPTIPVFEGVARPAPGYSSVDTHARQNLMFDLAIWHWNEGYEMVEETIQVVWAAVERYMASARARQQTVAAIEPAPRIRRLMAGESNLQPDIVSAPTHVTRTHHQNDQVNEKRYYHNASQDSDAPRRGPRHYQASFYPRIRRGRKQRAVQQRYEADSGLQNAPRQRFEPRPRRELSEVPREQQPENLFHDWNFPDQHERQTKQDFEVVEDNNDETYLSPLGTPSSIPRRYSCPIAMGSNFDGSAIPLSIYYADAGRELPVAPSPSPSVVASPSAVLSEIDEVQLDYSG